MLKASARLATRRPLTVCLAWLVLILIGFGVGSGVLADMQGHASSVPGSESQHASDLLDRLEPSSDTITAVVSGTTVARLKSQVTQAVDALRHVPEVTEVTDPYTTPGLVARDGQALLVEVTFGPDAHDHNYDRAYDLLHGIKAPSVQVSGGSLLTRELNDRAKHDVGNAELLSLPIVLIMMVLVFHGFRAALLPLTMTIGGIAGALLILYGFSLVTEISAAAMQVTTMLGLGLAVDYALLILTRFREERARDLEVSEAVRRTVATAGRTVLFSGLTVATCLAGLLIFPAPALRSIGMAAAAVIVVDMLAAVTLLPALLTRFGRTIPPRVVADDGGFFARIARSVARRPIAVLLTVGAALVVLALPVTGMKLADADARSLPHSSEARQMFDALAAHFPAGSSSSPVTVIMSPGTDPALTTRLRTLPGVVDATSRAFPNGTSVLALTPTGPSDGPVADRLVRQIRAMRGSQPVLVAGDAAHMTDYRAMLADRLPWALTAVLVAMLLLLFAFTGSILIPIKTIATTLLSLGAAMGIVVWIFQDGHLANLFGTQGVGALNAPMPPVIVAIAFGLAMDYEIFILGRMREIWLSSGDAHRAVVTGLSRTGKVVTCAALLLVIVFACFMTGGFAPVLQVGLGLTLAVVIDATIVRMLLVPATMALLGSRAWWAPAPMRRLHRGLGVREEAEGTPITCPPADIRT